MNENNDIPIELKSEPMNEMLSHPPSWIVRSGNGLFLLILLIVLGLAWFIEYSDEIAGEVSVTSTQPPIELNNQLYVQLKSIHVNDQQRVKKGMLLAQFDHQAKAEDIRQAEAFLQLLESHDLKTFNPITFPKQPLQLGVFQEKWTTLEKRIADWNTLKKDNLLNEQIASVKREIGFREELQRISGKKIKLSENEYALIRQELESSERLVSQNALSRQTLNQEKRTENQAQQSVQGQKEQYVQNEIVLNSLKKEILQLEHDRKLKEQQHLSDIELAIASLKSGFADWEQNAVWKAPCDGKILFNKHLQVNRYYSPNQASIVVVPNGNGFMATASVSGSGTGKIKAGQKAYIELSDYPKTEFGLLEGTVMHITQIDKEGKYEVAIRLPHQLKTTYHKNIPLKAQLKGTVKIITKKKRLLHRFFEKLTDLIQ